MDGKTYYQVIVIDTETDTYQAAKLWDGSPARKFTTLWEAEDNRAEWAQALVDLPHIHLGVQEVRSHPMPGSIPIAHYKQGT